MSVQDKAVERAIAFLKAAGAQYRIVLGDFSVDTFPQEQRKRSSPVNDWVALTDYRNRIRNMQEGDTITWTRDDLPQFAGDGWGSFASSANNACKHFFKPDTYVIDNANGSFTVLLVSKQ